MERYLILWVLQTLSQENSLKQWHILFSWIWKDWDLSKIPDRYLINTHQQSLLETGNSFLKSFLLHTCSVLSCGGTQENNMTLFLILRVSVFLEMQFFQKTNGRNMEQDKRCWVFIRKELNFHWNVWGSFTKGDAHQIIEPNKRALLIFQVWRG